MTPRRMMTAAEQRARDVVEQHLKSIHLGACGTYTREPDGRWRTPDGSIVPGGPLEEALRVAFTARVERHMERNAMLARVQDGQRLLRLEECLALGWDLIVQSDDEDGVWIDVLPKGEAWYLMRRSRTPSDARARNTRTLAGAADALWDSYIELLPMMMPLVEQVKAKRDALERIARRSQPTFP